MNYVSEALEQQVLSMKYLSACYAYPPLRGGGTISPSERDQWRTDIYSLHKAEPFYWNSRTVELVNSSIDAFNLDEITCSRDLLYCDVGWHWFAEKSPFEIELYKTKKMFPVRAITWYWFGVNGRPYFGATAWINSGVHGDGLPGGPLGPAVWSCVDEGQKMSLPIEGSRVNHAGYCDDRTVWEMEQLRRWTVAASTFLRQELLVTEHQPMERHARKRSQSTPRQREMSERLIQVVQLRRAKHLSANSSVASEVEWQCQWLVRGHVRKQWYATLQQHLPVYIHPYVKGPEDKPLKPRTTPIYSVTR